MRDGIGQVHYAVTAAARVGQVSTIYRTVARYTISAKQGLKWVGTHGNAVPRSAISGFWRSQASKIAFFCGNARSQTGKVVLSIIYQWTVVNLNLVKITDWLEIQGALQKWKEPTDFFIGAQRFLPFPLSLKLHSHPCTTNVYSEVDGFRNFTRTVVKYRVLK